MAKILIIGQKTDPHVKRVVSEIGDNARVCIYDRFDFDQISLSDYELQFDLCWRRIKPQMGQHGRIIFENLNREDFFEINWRTFLEGLGDSVSRKILHDSGKNAIAENKLRQLKAASEIGFNVPRTLFSNCIYDIVNFIDRNEETIVKPIRRSKVDVGKLIYTHKISKELIVQEESSVICVPNIYQEYIEKKYEIRLFAFGRNCVSVKILSQSTVGAETDWRASQHIKSMWHPYRMEEFEEKLIFDYLDYFGIHFGVFDLIRTPSGELVFLECNIDGQWLFMEQAAQTKVAKPFADWLVEMANA